ncbi:dimethylaniline monooxygenase [N-oxide-forming] 2-like [Branchiostoma floridae x Branchiostoma japonicum]
MGSKRVAIIGAGVSGLTSIKACLEEGLQPVCFEQHDDLGGVWYYSDDVRPNQGAAMYRSLITNSSKEMMSFSDFPFPKDTPPYLPYHRVYTYLQDYAQHFDLKKHIRFGTQVRRIEKTEDFDETGRWDVRTVQTGHSDVEQKEIFDAIMVCNGVFARPYVPDVPGLSDFSGVTMHSQEYRTAQQFRGKKVVVVGAGNSAGDVAAEIAQVASQVYLSLRDGAWVLPRLAQAGMPRDMMLRRVLMSMPEFIVNKIIKGEANARVCHDNYGLTCPAEPLKHSVMANDEIGYRLATGQVITKPQLSRFTQHTARFEDGSTVDGLDAVVFATGFSLAFNFSDKSILPDNTEDLNLYKLVFPTELTKPTLSVIGCLSTIGAHPPIYELQARWAVRVFLGLSKLPDKETMLKRVRSDKLELKQRFGYVKLQMMNVPYRDDIAEEIGVKPSFWKLLPRDPKLAFLCYFGPAFSVQYRLLGPHPWSGAADHAKSALANTLYPFRSPALDKEQSFLSLAKIIKFVLLFGMLLVALNRLL